MLAAFTVSDLAQWLQSPWLWQVGGGAIAGIAVAYALKKAVKVALALLGVGIILLFALAQNGIITVNWTALTRILDAGGQTAGQWATMLFKSLGASVVGFSGGALLGAKLR
ncbi:FUN14 domain-containing protein [Anthocerotibacter panamensis]|uniref:FUN14 domain-containing protein n=1 Tax=Anthocerotibacter panamensis TaxID=2857077 RepID=UPI001C402328|nr:FUN14 domain-containing protein [Anthocerotibacter panamensis]